MHAPTSPAHSEGRPAMAQEVDDQHARAGRGGDRAGGRAAPGRGTAARGRGSAQGGSVTGGRRPCGRSRGPGSGASGQRAGAPPAKTASASDLTCARHLPGQRCRRGVGTPNGDPRARFAAGRPMTVRLAGAVLPGLHGGQGGTAYRAPCTPSRRTPHRQERPILPSGAGTPPGPAVPCTSHPPPSFPRLRSRSDFVPGAHSACPGTRGSGR